MNDIDLLMAELDSPPMSYIKRGYFHSADPDTILDNAYSSSNPELFVHCMASIEQIVKRPTLGMVRYVKAQIQSSIVQSFPVKNYNSLMSDCPILERCPVFHLIHALNELPAQMDAPQELKVLTKVLSAERGRQKYYDDFTLRTYEHTKALSVYDLHKFVMLHLTNFSINHVAYGNEDTILKVG